MSRVMIRKCGVAALTAWLALATVVLAEGRSASKILDEYNAIEVPKLEATKRKTARALQDARSKRVKALNRRATLALELYKSDPENEQLPKIMTERWESRLNDPSPKKVAELSSELDGVLAKVKNEALLKEAAFTRATVVLRKSSTTPEAAQAAVDDFIKRDDKDERGALLLYNLADQTPDPARQEAIYKRLTDSYPKSSYAEEVKENAASRSERDSSPQGEAIGKPFNLAFNDALSGNPVSIPALKGKVVVIDFWATWCGPCVAEMPKMRELYAKYRKKGVEFIGVSLDQPREDGGYEQLVEFVTSNEIPWPQFYQGDSFKGEFTRSWEIRGIPTVFLVDADGKLVSTKARGRLDELIPKYLEKAKSRKGIKK